MEIQRIKEEKEGAASLFTVHSPTAISELLLYPAVVWKYFCCEPHEIRMRLHIA